jgi:hypothetical protein
MTYKKQTQTEGKAAVDLLRLVSRCGFSEKASPIPTEGLHQLEVIGERLVVDVRMTMQGQWPDTRELLMAHPLGGPPRFPWAVTMLLSWGGIFRRL